MDEVKLTWGKTPRDTLDRWPKQPDGAPEAPAFLARVSETDGEAEMLCAMLRSYDIPPSAITRARARSARSCSACPAAAFRSMSPPPCWRTRRRSSRPSMKKN